MKRPRKGGSKGGSAPSRKALARSWWPDCLPPYLGQRATGRRGGGGSSGFEPARRLLAAALEAADPSEQLRLGREAVALCPDLVEDYVALRDHVRALHPSAVPGTAPGGDPGVPDGALESPGGLASPMDTVRPDWAGDLGAVSPLHFGHNSVWVRDGLGLWDATAAPPGPDAAVLCLVAGLRPGVLRFPGGTRAMRYHFARAVGPLAGRKAQCDTFTGKTDSTGYGLDEFLGIAARIGAQVTLVSPWNDAPPEEAAALVAYVNADPGSSTPIGDGTTWGTAGDWARRRAANGHPAPYRVRFLEIGNEQYLIIPTPPDRSCRRPFPFCPCERWEGRRVPTTARVHAGLVKQTGELVRRVDPEIKIGASAYSRYDGSDAATAVALMDAHLGTGDAWNATLVAVAGGAFDYFVLHPYNLPTFVSGEPGGVMLPIDHLALAEGLRTTVRDLRALDPTKQVAVTEFGDLLYGGGAIGVLLAALVTRVALEEQLLMSLRHVLIEDNTTEPFAAAAILVPGLETTAAYRAVRLMTENLTGRVIRAATSHPRLAAFATREAAGGPVAIAFVRYHPIFPPGIPREVDIELPPGRWGGTAHTLSAQTLLSPSGQIGYTPIPVGPATGVLRLPGVPANALVIARLEQV